MTNIGNNNSMKRCIHALSVPDSSTAATNSTNPRRRRNSSSIADEQEPPSLKRMKLVGGGHPSSSSDAKYDQPDIVDNRQNAQSSFLFSSNAISLIRLLVEIGASNFRQDKLESASHYFAQALGMVVVAGQHDAEAGVGGRRKAAADNNGHGKVLSATTQRQSPPSDTIIATPSSSISGAAGTEADDANYEGGCNRSSSSSNNSSNANDDDDGSGCAISESASLSGSASETTRNNKSKPQLSDHVAATKAATATAATASLTAPSTSPSEGRNNVASPCIYDEGLWVYNEPIMVTADTTHADAAVLAILRYNVALTNARLGNFSAALSGFQAAERAFHGDKDKTKNLHSRLAILHNIGNCHFRMNNNPMALQSYQQALSILTGMMKEDAVHMNVKTNGHHHDHDQYAFTLPTTALPMIPVLPAPTPPPGTPHQWPFDRHLAVALNSTACISFHMHPTRKAKSVLAMLQQSHRLYQFACPDRIQDIATVLNNIGRVYFSWSKYDQALATYQQALQLRMQIATADDAVTLLLAKSVAKASANSNDDSTSTRSNGDISKNICNGAIRISNKTKLCNNAVDVAATMYNTGQCYHHLKQLDTAMQYYQMFLQLAIHAIGEKSRDVAIVYKRMAELYQQQKDSRNAMLFLKKSYESARVALGQYHPEVASLLNRLGNLSYELRDFQSAMNYYREGYRIEIHVLPENHPHIIITLTNIAHIHKDWGNYSAALEAYKFILNMQSSRSYDRTTQSIDMAGTLSSMGLIQYHSKDYAASFESYQEALRIRRDCYGTDDHPDIASTLNSVGLVLFKQEYYNLAKACFVESLRIRQQLMGKDHKDVAILWYNIATIYFETGQDDLAIQAYKETLRVERTALGEEHPDVVLTLQHLGQVHQQLGCLEPAAEYYMEALKIQRRVVGSNDLGMAKVLNLLGNCYLQQGSIAKMMECYVEASRIYEATTLPSRRRRHGRDGRTMPPPLPATNSGRDHNNVEGGETLIIAGYNFYGLSRIHPPAASVA